MPFTVITLKNVPPSLRGDLTKWMQEISTGVYVGNFNSRVREYLWDRVCKSTESGEATMSYSFHNEIGYDFKTLNSGRSVIDSDGIPLVLIPGNSKEQSHGGLKNGFSSAYKMHKAHMAGGSRSTKKEGDKTFDKKSEVKPQYVVLDIETTGLDSVNDDIIEIGAVKVEEEISYFHCLVNIHRKLPDNIVRLTGITDEMLSDGKKIQDAIKEFRDFIGDLPIVGYNINFDIMFINAALGKNGFSSIGNKAVDLLKIVKKEQLFQKDYKLSTTLNSYGIGAEVPHRALDDAKLIYQLSLKVNVF